MEENITKRFKDQLGLLEKAFDELQAIHKELEDIVMENYTIF